MTTCDELALSTLFDGELEGEEAHRTLLHLAECRTCQRTWGFYEWLEEAGRWWLRSRLASMQPP